MTVFWLAFAVLVVLATVQLVTWVLEWVREERSRRRSSTQVTRGIRG
jgi:cyanate permease